MIVAESIVNEALKDEDIESLVEAGAPENEYAPEAQSIVQALSAIEEREVLEEDLVKLIRSIWSRLFGPFNEEDLDKGSPAFRNVAERILASTSSLPHSASL